MTLRTLRSTFLLCLFALFASLCLPCIGLAQTSERMDPTEMMKRLQDPEAMKEMARQAEAMHACMAEIDKEKLEALRKRGEAASQEIDRLCAAGKKDQALSRSLELLKEMHADPTVKKLRACTKDMAEMMQTMPWGQIPGVKDEPEPTERDICS